MGMDVRDQVWKRVWKMSILGSEIGSGFGDTPPPRIPRNTHRESERLFKAQHILADMTSLEFFFVNFLKDMFRSTLIFSFYK